MKRILAVTLLLMSFASVAMADGPGLPPVKSTKPPTSRRPSLGGRAGPSASKTDKAAQCGPSCGLANYCRKPGADAISCSRPYEPYPAVHPARAPGAVVLGADPETRVQGVSHGFLPTRHSLWPQTWRGSLVHNHPHPYYATYWFTEAGYDLLGILVMYEVLRTVLGNLTRAWWARLIFPAVLVAGVGISLARADVVPSRLGGLLFYIVVGEIAVRFVQVFVFAGLVTLVPVLGLRWRQYPFGVATGFGLYATVMLLTTTKFSDFGTRFKFLWGVTSLVAYSLAVLIWIWFFSVPQKAETPSSELSAPSPGDLKQYKDALRRMR